MRVVPLLIAVVFASATFAGCVDDSVKGAGDDLAIRPDDVRLSATTGALRGAVSTDLFEPMAGALIVLVETGQETVVAKNGEYVMNDVPPAAYVVQAMHDGYVTGERRVTIAAGQIAEANFMLPPAASADPYVETTERAGMINSGSAITFEVPTMGCVYQPTPVYPVQSCNKQRSAGSPGQVQPFDVTDDVKSVLVELVWSPAGPLGEHLFMDLFCPATPRDDRGNPTTLDHVCYFPSEQTKSPIIHRVDEAHWMENEYEQLGEWIARVYPNHGTLGTYGAAGIDAGAAYQQAFTVFVSVYHRAPAPDGATGIPDQ